MGGVRRIGSRVLSRGESEAWVAQQTPPVCIVRLDTVTAELLLFYVAHRRKKEAPTPYPLALDETHLDELFAYTIEEGLPRIDAFLYGAFPYYEALLYATYAPQAIALSYAPWSEAPLLEWDKEEDDVTTLADAVATRGAPRVRVDGGLYQVALGVALKQRGISSAPKN